MDPIDLTTVTIDLTPVEYLLGIVIVALATLWGYRKLIRFANRS